MRRRRIHLEQLDEHLRKMPKPNLSKEKEQQIKQTLMNTRATKATPNKKRNFKGIVATFGSIAAAFLFAILIYGTIGNNPSTPPLSFASFVEDENITKIVGKASDNIYSSEEQEVINLFHETLGNLELIETNERSTISEEIELYNESEELIELIQFANSDLVQINNQWYEFQSDKWHQFKEIFFTEKYLTQENELDDEPEEEQEEIENIQELVDNELAKAPPHRDWEKILEYIRDGANPDRALLVATKENHEEMVRQLLAAGAKPNIVDNWNNSPLFLTTDLAVAKLLLDSGADIEHLNERNHTALVEAVLDHQTEKVQLLLEYGANPNTTVNPDSDISVLWMVGKNGDTDITELLVQYGATEIEGYDEAYWWLTESPSLSDMIELGEGLLSYVDIGRLPNQAAIQIPADPSIFPAQNGEPFESYRVENGTADVYGDHILIKEDEQNSYTGYRYELNPGDHVTIVDIINVLGEPADTFIKESGYEVMSYPLDYYELQFIFDGTESYADARTNIIALEIHYKQPGVDAAAEAIFDLLKEKDMNELANHVHPEKGLLFAPFLQLTFTPMTDEHEPVTFTTEEIPTLLDDETVYQWGYHGASGLPIEMTTEEYFENYVYTAQEPDAFYVNQQNLTGPEFFTEHVRGLFPEAHMVQYSFHETVEDEDLSWIQLTLIFEEYQGEWKLVGIMHNAWTP